MILRCESAGLASRELLFLAIVFLLPSVGSGQDLRFEDHIPEADRVQALKEYFDPPPDQQAYFLKKHIDRLKNPYQFDGVFGLIRVSPPKGVCFVVQRNSRYPDIRVCAERKLRFYASDLDDYGAITWMVYTHSKDVGTYLRWGTPYRVGKAVPFEDSWPGPSRILIIGPCTSKVGEKRRIDVKVLGFKNKFIINFPKFDYLVDQPKGRPNLLVQSQSKKAGFKAENAAAMKSGMKKDGGAHHGRFGGRHNISAAEARGMEVKKFSKKGVFGRSNDMVAKKKTKFWQLLPRNTYTMNGAHFVSQAAASLGTLGRCRYNYKGSDKYSPGTPVLECNEVDQFHYIFMPLTCLKDVQKTKK